MLLDRDSKQDYARRSSGKNFFALFRKIENSTFMVIWKQFIRSIPWFWYILVLISIFIIEILLNDVVYIGQVYSYIISPSHGILVIIPVFLFLELTIWKAEENICAVLVDLRLSIRGYLWKQVLLSYFSSALFCCTLFLCEALVCFFSKISYPMNLMLLSLIIKWIYFSVLSVIMRISIIGGINSKMTVGGLYIFCVFDYILSYTRMSEIGFKLLIWHAFSGMNNMFSGLILSLWLLFGTIVLSRFQVEFHEYIGEK